MENSLQGFNLLYHQFYAITDSLQENSDSDFNNIIKALQNKEIVSQEYFLEVVKAIVERTDLTKEMISETFSN